MADSKKIIEMKRILADLEYVWMRNADLRLGQLMEVLYGCGVCMFYRDDETVAKALREARDKGLVSDVGTDDGNGVV